MFTSPHRLDIRDLSNKSLKYFQYTFQWMILQRFKWYYVKLMNKWIVYQFFKTTRRFKWYYVKLMKKWIGYQFFKATWLCIWSGFGCAIDRQNSWWNPLTKIRSCTYDAWKWVLCHKLLWFYWNILLYIQHVFIMTPGDFFIIIIARNMTPIVKGLISPKAL